jgi:5'-nucleotidase
MKSTKKRGVVPRILVSNDDGYNSEGIRALAAAVAPLGEVWVVAPESQQSASSRSISLNRPLRLREVEPRWFAVDGTPTDCAYLAINHVLKDNPPSLMVAGINHGPNLADDITYSGTVAGAIEASLIGVPAIAFSVAARRGYEFGPASLFARGLVEAALSEELPPGFLLNVNVPLGVDPRSYVVTRLGKHSYGGGVEERLDPRGRAYYWIGGNEYQHEDIPGSDCNVVYDEKRISVTPIHLDLTHTAQIANVQSWVLPGFDQSRG